MGLPAGRVAAKLIFLVVPCAAHDVTSSQSTNRKNLVPLDGTVSRSLRGRGLLSRVFPRSTDFGPRMFLSRGWADLSEVRAATQAKGSMSAARAILDDVYLNGEAVRALKGAFTPYRKCRLLAVQETRCPRSLSAPNASIFYCVLTVVANSGDTPRAQKGVAP